MQPSLSPSLQQVAECNLAWSDELNDIRSDIIQEVRALVDQWDDHTQRWWTNLPEHLQLVYQDQESGYLTQVPVFLHMLERCGYPGLHELSEDLNCGFATVGPLHSGTGWLPRCDGKYSDPLPLDIFERANQTYLYQKLRQGFVDEHWQVMLEELIADRAQGRLVGPFRAPPQWPIPSAGIPGEPLLPAPEGRVCAAVCFSVCQSDKVRRCEDYRRSFHNATITAPDVPHHDDISVYVQLSKWWRQHTSEDIGIWAHDLDAAYRQLGVRDTSFAYVVLITPGGPLLFRHTALCFGSSASVWSFNRMADAMVFLGSSSTLGVPMRPLCGRFWQCGATAHCIFRFLGIFRAVRHPGPENEAEKSYGTLHITTDVRSHREDPPGAH